MAEKQLNVRLQLKYDTYENWSTNNPKLLAGEVALTTVSVKQEGKVNAVPSVMMKVGDGTHLYNELEFTHSLAADVHEWAKAANKPSYNASEISGIDAKIADYVSNEMGIEVDTDTQYSMVKVNNYQYKLMSKSKGDESFATEVAVIDIPKYDDTQVKADIVANAGAIEALEGLVGTTAVATQIANAIAALNLGETYAAKSHTHTKAEITDFAHNHEMSEINGLVDALAGKEVAGEAAKVQGNLETYIESNNAAVALKASQADLEAEIERAGKAEKANADAIVAIKDGESLDSFGDVESELTKYQLAGDYATKAEAQGYANAKDGAIEAAHKAGTDAQADVDALELKVGTVAEGSTVVGMIEAVDGKADKNAEDIVTINEAIKNIQENAYDDTELRGLISDNAEAIEALEGTHATDKEALEGAIQTNTEAIAKLNGNVETEGSVDYKIAQAVADIMENPDETMNSINELVTWVNDHAEDALELSNQVSANKGAIETLNGTGAGSVDKKIADAISGANLGQYALDSDLDAAVKRIGDLETADGVQDGLLAGLRTDVDAKATQADLNTLAGRVTTAEGEIDALQGAIATKVENSVVEALDERVVVVEGKAHEHKNFDLLETYTQTEANLADAVAKKHSHANATVLDGITSDKVNAWDAAEQNAKDYADGLAGNYDAKGAAETALGSAKEYADGLNTAMDSRVDALEALPTNTLLDTDTFIFNCGTSKF